MYRQVKQNEIANAIQCISNDGYAIPPTYRKASDMVKIDW